MFAAQCMVFWTAGIKLWLVLDAKGISTAGANAVVLVVCFAAIAVFSEIFHRCLDLPSIWAAKSTYLWLLR